MRQSLPRISVITPSYNQGPYLERTILSVLDQNYPNLQYLIFDGGSTDNSVEIIKKYSHRLNYWVSSPDSGQASAINAGLERCDGDIVAYINSDDWYAHDSFATVERHFTENPEVKWLIGTCSYQSTQFRRLLKGRVPLDPARWVGEGLWLPQASSFWSKEIFETIGHFRTDMHFSFDLEFGVRALFAGYRPHFIQAVLANRWLHENCKTVALPENFHLELDRFIEIFGHHLTEQKLEDAKSLVLRRYLQYYIEQDKFRDAAIVFLNLLRRHPRSALAFCKSAFIRRFKLKGPHNSPWH